MLFFFFTYYLYVRVSTRKIKGEGPICLNLTTLNFQLLLCPIFPFYVAVKVERLRPLQRGRERREEHIGEEGDSPSS